MTLNRISLYLAIILLSSCGVSNKNTQIIPKPDWVMAKPIQSAYYIGVGSAIKSNDGDRYMKMAKKNALASLSSEISVSISSQSVLHQYETEGGFSEDFQNMIQTSSSAFVGDYERVATFDDGTYYWEYYRLLKSTYEDTKQRRMQQATDIALNHLQKGQVEKNQNNIYNSLSAYAKGLEAIKPFWGEALEAQFNGKTIYLGNELYKNSIELLKQIKIQRKQREVIATAGGNIPSSYLSFVVSSSDNTPLADIPVLFYANNKPIKNNKLKSNSEGSVSYSYAHIPLNIRSISFKAKLDINSLVSSITKDAFFRKMLRAVDVSESNIEIHVKNPSFYVKTEEPSIGKKGANTALDKWLVNNNYPLINTSNNADYTLLLSSVISENKKENKLVYLTLKVSLKLFDKNNILLSSTTFPDIDGVRTSPELAVKDAYEKFEELLDRKMNVFLTAALK